MVQNVRDVCILKDSHFGAPIENKKCIIFFKRNKWENVINDDEETRRKLYLNLTIKYTSNTTTS